MKLDSKGLTLVELLISIVLVGIVIVFLFQILMDLKDEADNKDFAFDNQINRIEAVYAVQRDLNNYVLIGVEDKSEGDNIIIHFYFRKDSLTKTSTLSIENSSKEIKVNNSDDDKYYLNSSILKYRSVDENNYKWNMKDAYIDKCGSFSYQKDSSNYYFLLKLFVYNSVLNEKNSPSNNNVIDDIEISNAGLLLDLVSNENYLTYKTGDQKVGSCRNNGM